MQLKAEKWNVYDNFRSRNQNAYWMATLQDMA